MQFLVPFWRPDPRSARRLYGFSDGLSDTDVVKAVEQVRHQRAGTTSMPPWLNALGGFALLEGQEEVARWVADADEKALLIKLAAALNAAGEPVIVFAQAADLVKKLQLRFVVQQLSAEHVAGWAERFRDGAAWQPDALCREPEAADAILALASGRALYNPWQQESPTPEHLCTQALALRDLFEKDWI